MVTFSDLDFEMNEPEFWQSLEGRGWGGLVAFDPDANDELLRMFEGFGSPIGLGLVAETLYERFGYVPMTYFGYASEKVQRLSNHDLILPITEGAILALRYVA